MGERVARGTLLRPDTKSWPGAHSSAHLSACVCVWARGNAVKSTHSENKRKTKDSVVKVFNLFHFFFLFCPLPSSCNVFSGRRTLPRSFMPQENLFQLVPSSRTRSYNGDSTLQYSDLRSLGRSAEKSCQRSSAKCKQ